MTFIKALLAFLVVAAPFILGIAALVVFVNWFLDKANDGADDDFFDDFMSGRRK